MTCYDIFNGDADGICALVQLRLAEPRNSQLVTGVKRDINLLERVKAKPDDHLTVLDISMRSNQGGLARALKTGAHVFYVDHHSVDDIPKHENLFTVIDTRSDICTSILVNKCLKGQFAEWAVVAAFGDNMVDPALRVSKPLGLSGHVLKKLQKFGELINYNGYGSTVADLHFAPDQLFRRLVKYDTPTKFLTDQPRVFEKLKSGFAQDMDKAVSSKFIDQNVVLLDDAPWARRVSGSFANRLATKNPDQAHAILTHNSSDSYTVSVRAPKNNPKGADRLCFQFKTGGGRSAAAGINHLPKDGLKNFLKLFRVHFTEAASVRPRPL